MNLMIVSFLSFGNSGLTFGLFRDCRLTILEGDRGGLWRRDSTIATILTCTSTLLCCFPFLRFTLVSLSNILYSAPKSSEDQAKEVTTGNRGSPRKHWMAEVFTEGQGG